MSEDILKAFDLTVHAEAELARIAKGERLDDQRLEAIEGELIEALLYVRQARRRVDRDPS